MIYDSRTYRIVFWSGDMRVRKGRRKRGSFKIPKVNCIISGYVCLCLCSSAELVLVLQFCFWNGLMITRVGWNLFVVKRGAGCENNLCSICDQMCEGLGIVWEVGVPNTFRISCYIRVHITSILILFLREIEFCGLILFRR